MLQGPYLQIGKPRLREAKQMVQDYLLHLHGSHFRVTLGHYVSSILLGMWRGVGGEERYDQLLLKQLVGQQVSQQLSQFLVVQL